MSFAKNNQNKSSSERRVTRCAVQLADNIRTEFPALVQERRESARILAFKVKKTPRQIQNLEQGNSVASLPTAIALGWHIPELRLQMLRWMAAEAAIDPEIDRLTIELARRIQEFMERKRP